MIERVFSLWKTLTFNQQVCIDVYSRHGLFWDDEEGQLLEDLFRDRMSIHKISKVMKRSPNSIAARLAHLDLVFCPDYDGSYKPGDEFIYKGKVIHTWEVFNSTVAQERLQ